MYACMYACMYIYMCVKNNHTEIKTLISQEDTKKKVKEGVFLGLGQITSWLEAIESPSPVRSAWAREPLIPRL